MAITHTFKGSKGANGYGYYAYISDGELVIGESWPHEGGELYRGSYENAGKAIASLRKEAPVIADDIEAYYAEELVKNAAPKAARNNDTHARWASLVYDGATGLPLFVCSNCAYSALNDFRGRSTASKFCPHCGKYMTNHQQPEDDE